jgi:hypothetical protein
MHGEGLTFQVLVQTVSLLGVAAGLAYTGLQLRNWRTAHYVANFTKLVELQMQLRKMVVDDPTLASASLGSGIEISLEEIRGGFYNLMQVSLFEIAWFSHRHGQLTEDYFRTWTIYMMTVVQRPAFRQMWEIDRSKILHNRFHDYMETVVGTPRRTTGNDTRSHR